MKFRRHHNNDGRRQIKRGKSRDWAERARERYLSDGIDDDIIPGRRDKMIKFAKKG